MFGGGKFENLDDLIKVVSGTIFMSSVVHAAVNFCQYDEYAFPPNYPAKMVGEIPKDKVRVYVNSYCSNEHYNQCMVSETIYELLLKYYDFLPGSGIFSA